MELVVEEAFQFYFTYLCDFGFCLFVFYNKHAAELIIFLKEQSTDRASGIIYLCVLLIAVAELEVV